MCIKENNNQITFTVLEFSKLTIFDQKISFKNFWKAPAGFELTTYRFVVYALTLCTTLINTNFGKGKIFKIYLILMFISIESTSQYINVPYHL